MGISREGIVEKSANMDEEADKRQHRKVELNLKPIIFCLGLAGCYSFQQWRNVFTEIFMFVYKILVVAAVMFWCIRPFFMTEYLQPVITYVVLMLIALQGVCNWILCWKSFSTKFGNFKAFMDKMNVLQAAFFEDSIILNTNFISKRQIMYVFFAGFLILSDVIMQIIIYYFLLPNPKELEAVSVNATFSMTYPFRDSYFSRAISILPGFFVSLVVVIPPFYLAIVNTMLIATFDALNTRMEGCLTRNGDILNTVETFRLFHVKICSIISQFDKDMRYLYGSIFFWTLCQGILVLYLLIRSNQSFMEVITLLYMMGLSMTVLTVMSILAALVHEAVSFT